MKWMTCLILPVVFATGAFAADKKVTGVTKEKEKIAEPIEPPQQGIPLTFKSLTSAGGDPNARRVSEFTGDPMDIVLRTLARQAKMSLVISPKVQGSVNLRLEDKTPREVIDAIVEGAGLIMKEHKGVLYISHPEEPHISRAKQTARDARILLDALLAEKFTREEAMQIVLLHEGGKREKKTGKK